MEYNSSGIEYWNWFFSKVVFIVTCFILGIKIGIMCGQSKNSRSKSIHPFLTKSSNIDSSAIPGNNPDLCIRNKRKER